MPFTPYHFGINALPALVTRGKLDMCLLISANVLIDVEVLADNYFAPGWPTHQLWHFHTLLIGGLAGAAMGAAVYWIKPAQTVCCKINSHLGFSFRPTLFSMIISGLLGAWLHVIIDSLYHYDVQLFWPIQQNLIMNWAQRIHFLPPGGLQNWVIKLCVTGWIAAGILLLTHKLITFKTIKTKN